MLLCNLFLDSHHNVSKSLKMFHFSTIRAKRVQFIFIIKCLNFRAKNQRQNLQVILKHCGSELYEFIEFEILISESMQRKVMWNNQLYEVYLKEDMRGRFWYWNWKMSLAGRIFCHVSNKNDKKRNENEGCVPTYKKSHFTTLRAECVIFSCQIYLNFRAKMSEFVIL